MGRYQKRGRRSERKRQDNDQSQPKENGEEFVAKIVEEGNFRMEVYYALQGLHKSRWSDTGELVPCIDGLECQEERLKWRSTAVKILPASFRITKDVPDLIREKLERELRDMLQRSHQQDNANEKSINELKFLPQAYQLELDRSTIRKLPHLFEIKEWLKQQTSAGFISRQETVSMVPPVVLAPEPSDRILDMCAAPGSKTSQLLECLGPKGCIVANDSNEKRCHLLVSQLRRIMYMNPQAVVTCCEGQLFPALMQFDRILCDVPCSGDGTARKNIDVWQSWSQSGALSLHALQLQIAWKGVSELLKVGGFMCYSTCSMNPIEDEAVIAELLRRASGSLELVEVRLEGFKTRPGWTKWKVMCEEKSRREEKNERKKNNDSMKAKRKDWKAREVETTGGSVLQVCTTEPVGGESPVANDKQEIEKESSAAQPDVAHTRKFRPDSMDERTLVEMAASAGFHVYDSLAEVPKHLDRRVRDSCFPPTELENELFHLQRCIRCLPHDNNTGGFFVALLHKAREISAKDKREAAQTKPLDDSEPESKRAKMNEDENGHDFDRESSCAAAASGAANRVDGGGRQRSNSGKVPSTMGRDDFAPVKDSVLSIIVEEFGLCEDTFEKDLLMTRATGDNKTIYFIPRPIKDLIDKGLQQRVTMVNAGLKAFSRSSLEGNQTYRICQESCHFLAPFMTKRKFVVCFEDFDKCFTAARHVEIKEFTQALQNQLKGLEQGSVVLILEGFEDQHNHKMVCTMWRCRSDRLDKMISKVEVDAIKTKLESIRGKLLKDDSC